MTDPLVVFSHGLESGPWGSKITAMAEIADSRCARVISVDYQGERDPGNRVRKLQSVLRDEPYEKLILVGSSMGGHVATAAAIDQAVDGVFVLAPAFHMPGYEAITPAKPDCPMEIVHGWHDDVVPVENSIRFAREHNVTLHLVNSDHRLGDAIDTINQLLAIFIDNCLKGAPDETS
ncbi:MAG: alpha/beta hydrolase [Woeseiaceae bacterium]